MEETREKIELFRNYYLVCFRSFDQDPYSPTYLEPLNMYIIVFREGTLSFHFRATPHPQNVRRRIKQLKDYINVTSDWISYALIDDITDAFGPLIQSIEYEVDSVRVDRWAPAESADRRARPHPEGGRAVGYAASHRHLPQEGHGPAAAHGQQGRRRQGSRQALQRELVGGAKVRQSVPHSRPRSLAQSGSTCPTSPIT